MSNLAGVVHLLRKEQDRLTKELRGIGAALAAFGKAYGKGTGTRELSQVSSGVDRSCPTSAMGKSPANGQRRSNPAKADALGGRTSQFGLLQKLSNRYCDCLVSVPILRQDGDAIVERVEFSLFALPTRGGVLGILAN